MAKKSFMLVNLKGKTAKELAKVLSSDTGKKILDFMSDKESVTETEVSEKLNVPLSTVHYNMQQLVKAKLVTANEYHYSKRGKEILHYKLAKKYIVIAPEEDKRSFFEHMKKYVPAVVIAAGFAAVWKILRAFSGRAASAALNNAVPKAGLMQEAAYTGADSLRDTAMVQAPAAAQEAVNNITQQAVPQAAAEAAKYTFGFPEYFLFGALAVIILLIIIEYVIWRRKK